MLSKNRIKFIHSLSSKKQRDASGVFVAEGSKTVNELLKYFDCSLLIHTEDWEKPNYLNSKSIEEVEIASETELSRASFLKTPQKVLGIFKKKDLIDSCLSKVEDSLCIGLDSIQDPGNLGTIIRIADWFGIKNIFCSPDTADAFSPKTIQATMGAIARVNIIYTSLTELVGNLSEGVPIYGTFLEGENIYQEQLEQRGLIIMGNEGNGISREMEKLISQRLYIPSFPVGEETSESLNVAVATAIVCAEFRRQASMGTSATTAI